MVNSIRQREVGERNRRSAAEEQREESMPEDVSRRCTFFFGKTCGQEDKYDRLERGCINVTDN